MTTSQTGWAVAIILGVALGITCYGSRGDSAERARAKMVADSLRLAGSMIAAQAEADSLIHARATKRLADTLAKMDTALTAALARVHALATPLLSGPDTSAVPRVTVQAALRADSVAIALLDAKVTTLAADTVAWLGRWRGAVATSARWQALSRVLQIQLDAANLRVAPRWVCAGGVTGATTAHPTLVAGLGVTCGVRL